MFVNFSAVFLMILISTYQLLYQNVCDLQNPRRNLPLLNSVKDDSRNLKMNSDLQAKETWTLSFAHIPYQLGYW